MKQELNFEPDPCALHSGAPGFQQVGDAGAVVPPRCCLGSPEGFWCCLSPALALQALRTPREGNSSRESRAELGGCYQSDAENIPRTSTAESPQGLGAEPGRGGQGEPLGGEIQVSPWEGRSR